MTSIRLAFSMGNFFFWVVVDGVLTSPLTPLFPFTPLDAFLHLDVNSVTVEVGKKDSVPPMGFWKVCQWWKIQKFSSGARKLQVVQIFGRISNLKWTQAKKLGTFFVCQRGSYPTFLLLWCQSKMERERESFYTKKYLSLLLEWWITFPNGATPKKRAFQKKKKPLLKLGQKGFLFGG